MQPKQIFILFLLLLIFYAWYQLFLKKEKHIRKVFPSKWRLILKQKVRFYRQLSKAEKDRFEQRVLQFLNKITITGVDAAVTDVDRIFVASSAVIPIFGFPNWRYRNINEVLLYEKSFNANYQTRGRNRNILGMVGTGTMSRMMILSKPALHQGFKNRRSKSNVGIHEFVHLLDMSDGVVDGLPENLMKHQFVLPWLHEMHEEIKDIKRQKSNINPYGATNEAEFLSVASEYFFNQPELFKKHHSELFELLEEIYNQDLA